MNPVLPVVAIAKNTFKEAVRDKVLYAFVLFAFVATAFGILLGSISVGQDLRILEDMGLAVISLIGGIIGIFSGTSLVYKEIERRTIYLIVTKPISRWQFVLGKYSGLVLCLMVVTAAMGAFLMLMVWFLSPVHVVSAFLLESCVLIYLELMFVTAVATFFSTFATPIMSVVFTLAAWLIGHLGQSIRDLGHLSDNRFVSAICDLIYWVLPDLARLTQVRAELMYGRQPDGELLLYLLSYILAYIILLLSFSTYVTERREFP